MAGGEGSRLSAVSMGVPKPLVQVRGKPFVWYALTLFEESGIDTIYMLIRQGDRPRFLEDLKEFPSIQYVITRPNVNKAICSIPIPSQEPFILLNGDCYPLMNFSSWVAFCDRSIPTIAVGPSGEDVGMAIIHRDLVQGGYVDCSRLSGMVGGYPSFMTEGVLEINDPEGLAQARELINRQDLSWL